tara:strand:- start:582 stop:761 length:180 start_codon:yes stop_codon:yes gene_type:complete
MTERENSERLDRHEKVIEKLIEQVAKLQIASNIQNVINQANYAGNQDDTKDISDSSLRS